MRTQFSYDHPSLHQCRVDVVLLCRTFVLLIAAAVRGTWYAEKWKGRDEMVIIRNGKGHAEPIANDAVDELSSQRER